MDQHRQAQDAADRTLTVENSRVTNLHDVAHDALRVMVVVFRQRAAEMQANLELPPVSFSIC